MYEVMWLITMFKSRSFATRRLCLWLNLSTDLNPSQLVSPLPKPVEARNPVEAKQPKRGKPMQKRGRAASSVHPDRQPPVQERGEQQASCSHSGHLEMRPNLPGSVQDENECSHPTWLRQPNSAQLKTQLDWDNPTQPNSKPNLIETTPNSKPNPTWLRPNPTQN